MLVAEAPGKDEDLGGRPFIGQAGRELNEHYLGLAGLDRENIYVTNTVKCRPDLNRKPNAREVVGCSRHFMPSELDSVQPDIVILMGATACSLLPDIDLDADHGIPRLGELFGWQGWLVPLYHPAAGLHDTAMMTPLIEDWTKLKRWLSDGTWQWAVDELDGRRDYGLLDSKCEAEEFMHRCWRSGAPYLIGGDTETHDGEPYSWQVSVEDGVARMMMVDNKEVGEVVANGLNSMFNMRDTKLVFHNAHADLDIFEKQMSVVTWYCSLDGCYRDTMQEASHFGNLKQGLKPLSRRLLGRQRKSWEETVGPHSKAVLMDWMMRAFVVAESEWQTKEQRVSEKTGKPLKERLVRSKAEKLLVELLGYTMNNPEYKVWDKLVERVDGGDIERLVRRLGPIPQKGIAHVPLDEQIEYACADADDTRRLALLFDRMRVEFVKELNVQTEDYDNGVERGR